MAHVAVAAWLDNDHRKGENITFGNEAIVYQLPLERKYKSAIVDVLNRFTRDYGVKLSIRTHKGDEKRRDVDDVAGEQPKIHRIVLKVENTDSKCSAEERISRLRAAEATVDAFIHSVAAASEQEIVYMLPPDDGTTKAFGDSRADRWETGFHR